MFCPDMATYNGAKVQGELTVTTKGTDNSFYEDVVIEATEFRRALTSDDDSGDRSRANSFDNAIRGQSSNSYYYGVDPQEVGSSRDADYWKSPLGWGWVKTWYKYTYYHKITYYLGRARRYYRHLPTSWVRWEYDSQAHGYITSKKVKDSYMDAHVYADGKIYEINQTKVDGHYRATKGNVESGGNNNHMYVIQTSRTSDDYVIGRPTLENNESTDDVVSPAFMIASQLGLVREMDFDAAKTHCAQYVEVGLDGKVYDHWRLPTVKEISRIRAYQENTAVKNNTLAEVLTGNYWALNRDRVNISGTIVSARCVRDLTPEDLVDLSKVK